MNVQQATDIYNEERSEAIEILTDAQVFLCCEEQGLFPEGTDLESAPREILRDAIYDASVTVSLDKIKHYSGC